MARENHVRLRYNKVHGRSGVNIPVSLLGAVAEDDSISIPAETTVSAANLALGGTLVLEEVDAVLDVANGSVLLATLDTGSSGAGSDGKGRDDGSGLHFESLEVGWKDLECELDCREKSELMMRRMRILTGLMAPYIAFSTPQNGLLKLNLTVSTSLMLLPA